MEERRISKHAHNTFSGISLIECLLSAVCHREAGSHTDGGIQCGVWLVGCQCVASDISAYHNVFSLAQTIEQTSVRAACTERRCTIDQFFFVKLDCFERLAIYSFTNNIRCHFQCIREKVFAVEFTFHTQSLHEFLDIRIIFLQYVNFIHLITEIFDQILRHWIGKSKFQIGSLISEYFFCIVIADTGSNDTYRGVTHLYSVKWGRLTVLFQFFHSCLQFHAQFSGNRRKTNIFGRIFLPCL